MEIPKEPGFIAVIVGWVATTAIFLFRGGRHYEKQDASIADHENRITAIEDDYLTSKDQTHCQQHVSDALALALEKRDREFDRKFSVICQGITEIKSELNK